MNYPKSILLSILQLSNQTSNSYFGLNLQHHQKTWPFYFLKWSNVYCFIHSILHFLWFVPNHWFKPSSFKTGGLHSLCLSFSSATNFHSLNYYVTFCCSSCLNNNLNSFYRTIDSFSIRFFTIHQGLNLEDPSCLLWWESCHQIDLPEWNWNFLFLSNDLS